MLGILVAGWARDLALDPTLPHSAFGVGASRDDCDPRQLRSTTTGRTSKLHATRLFFSRTLRYPNTVLMSPQVPGPRVEISDLMEATFWEANKVRLGVSVAAIVVAILGWQGWQGQKESAQAAGWSALLDPETLSVRESLAMGSEIEGSTAAPWARLAIARQAYAEKAYDKAEATLKELRDRGEFAVVDQDRIASSFEEDTKSESSFLGAHAEPAKPVPGASDPKFEVTTDAGTITIAVFDKSQSAASTAFTAALRENRLIGLSFKEADEDGELRAELDAAHLPNGLGAGEDWSGIRSGRLISNYAGTVAIRTDVVAKAGDPQKYTLVVNLEDAGMRDSDSIVVGTVVSGLELLKTASARDVADDGSLKPPVVISAVAEKT